MNWNNISWRNSSHPIRPTTYQQSIYLPPPTHKPEQKGISLNFQVNLHSIEHYDKFNALGPFVRRCNMFCFGLKTPCFKNGENEVKHATKKNGTTAIWYKKNVRHPEPNQRRREREHQWTVKRVEKGRMTERGKIMIVWRERDVTERAADRCWVSRDAVARPAAVTHTISLSDSQTFADSVAARGRMGGSACCLCVCAFLTLAAGSPDTPNAWPRPQPQQVSTKHKYHSFIFLALTTMRFKGKQLLF